MTAHSYRMNSTVQPFKKQEQAELAEQSSASSSIAPVKSNENSVILKTGSINGAGDQGHRESKGGLGERFHMQSAPNLRQVTNYL